MEVAAWSATKSQINAAGIKSFKGAELLSDDEGSVVGEHDAAAADADGSGCGGDVSDEDGRCRAHQALDGVMLGEPEAAVAPLLGVAGEIDGTCDGGRGCFAGAHADEIEDRDR